MYFCTWKVCFLHVENIIAYFEKIFLHFEGILLYFGSILLVTKTQRLQSLSLYRATPTPPKPRPRHAQATPTPRPRPRPSHAHATPKPRPTEQARTSLRTPLFFLRGNPTVNCLGKNSHSWKIQKMPGILDWKITIDLGCKRHKLTNLYFFQMALDFPMENSQTRSFHGWPHSARGGKAEEERQRRRLKSRCGLFVFNQRLEASKVLDNLPRFFGVVLAVCMSCKNNFFNKIKVVSFVCSMKTDY